MTIVTDDILLCHPGVPERSAGGTSVVVALDAEAPDLPLTMAVRGSVVCRAAGGLTPARWRPTARGATAGHRPGPGSAARAARGAGRLDVVQKFLTPDQPG